MTLKDCPECSGQVSTEADRCPHCGYPVNPAQSDVSRYRIGRLKRGRIFCSVAAIGTVICFVYDHNIQWLFATLISFLGLFVASLKIDVLKNNEEDNDS